MPGIIHEGGQPFRNGATKDEREPRYDYDICSLTRPAHACHEARLLTLHDLLGELHDVLKATWPSDTFYSQTWLPALQRGRPELQTVTKAVAELQGLRDQLNVQGQDTVGCAASVQRLIVEQQMTWKLASIAYARRFWSEGFAFPLEEARTSLRYCGGFLTGSCRVPWVPLLSPQIFKSVKIAVFGLATGRAKCRGGICAVYSEESQCFFAIYRSDRQATATRALGGTPPTPAVDLVDNIVDSRAEMHLLGRISELERHIHDDAKVTFNPTWRQFRRHAVWRTFVGRHKKDGIVSGVLTKPTATHLALFLHEVEASIVGLQWQPSARAEWLKQLDSVTDPVELGNLMLDVHQQLPRVTKYQRHSDFQAVVSNICSLLRKDADDLQANTRGEGKVELSSGAGQVAAGCLGILGIAAAEFSGGLSLGLCFGSGALGLGATLGDKICNKHDEMDKVKEKIKGDLQLSSIHSVVAEVNTIQFALRFVGFGAKSTKDFGASDAALELNEDVKSLLAKAAENIKTTDEIVQGVLKTTKLSVGMARYYQLYSLVAKDSKEAEEIAQAMHGIVSDLCLPGDVTYGDAFKLVDQVGVELSGGSMGEMHGAIAEFFWKDGKWLCDTVHDFKEFGGHLAEIEDVAKQTWAAAKAAGEAAGISDTVAAAIRAEEAAAEGWRAAWGACVLAVPAEEALKVADCVADAEAAVNAGAEAVTGTDVLFEAGSKASVGFGVLSAFVDLFFGVKGLLNASEDLHSDGGEFAKQARTVADFLDDSAEKLEVVWASPAASRRPAVPVRPRRTGVARVLYACKPSRILRRARA